MRQLIRFMYFHPHCRFCSSRSTVYGIWMYTDGTTRWNLRVPCSRKCADVSGGTGSRNCNLSSITWSAEKESRLGNKC